VTFLQIFGVILVVGIGITLWTLWKEYRNRANGPGDPRRNG